MERDSLPCKLKEAERLPFLEPLRFEVCSVELLLAHTARGCRPCGGGGSSSNGTGQELPKFPMWVRFPLSSTCLVDTATPAWFLALHAPNWYTALGTQVRPLLSELKLMNYYPFWTNNTTKRLFRL